MIKSAKRVLSLGAVALLAACTQGSSQIEAGAPTAAATGRGGAGLRGVRRARCSSIPGLSGTIDETLGANRLPPRTAKELQIGRQVANALADKLVVEIRDLGLPAERGSGLPPGVPTGLVISGQFVSVDQGNRTERVDAGPGCRPQRRAGAGAGVRGVAAGPYASPTRSRSTPRAGLQPGMAETMGVGALAGHFVTATLVSGGLQVADEVAGHLGGGRFRSRRQGHRQAAGRVLRRAGLERGELLASAAASQRRRRA